MACTSVMAQKDTGIVQISKAIEQLPEQSIQVMERKYSRLSEAIERQNQKILEKMQKQETWLQRKMQSKDSLIAARLFAGSEERYSALRARLNQVEKLGNSSLKEYIPGLDSLQTGMRYLDQAKGKLSVQFAEKIKGISAINKTFDNLQVKMNQAQELNNFLRERKMQIKEQLDKLQMGRYSSVVSREVYYYQQKINTYKDLLKNRKKMENKALEILRNTSSFKSFMQKNSYLARLFPAAGAPVVENLLDGIQSRSQVQELINQRTGISGFPNNGEQQQSALPNLQQQLQQAQTQLAQQKDKLNKAIGGSDAAMDMPDFKPNGQKTKTFLQRIEYGFNVQSQNNRGILPAMTDLGLSLGYKVSDNAVLGIGGSYKIGWGRLFDHIRLSGQGASLRSFLDIKAKGSLWITGGYELNCLQQLDSLSRVAVNVNKWQRSGLLGLTRKYKIGKKEGKLQLLWDFLNTAHVPKSPALKFRLGYSF